MQRNRCIKVRLSDNELNTINEFVEQSGYKSREHYIRTVLLKSVPKEQPNVDYQKLIFEFNRIGNNLNQLVQLSYSYPIIEQNANETLSQLKELMKDTEYRIRGC